MKALPASKSTSTAISANGPLKVIAGPLSRNLISDLNISLVVVGIPSLPQDRLKEVAAEAFAAGANVAFVPQLSCSSETSTDYVDIDGVLIASMGNPKLKRLYEATKRLGDFVLAFALLLVTLPLWAALAVLIRLDSEGPAFFRQQRVGRSNKGFNLYSSVPCVLTHLSMAFIPPTWMTHELLGSVVGCAAPVLMNCHSSSMF